MGSIVHDVCPTGKICGTIDKGEIWSDFTEFSCLDHHENLSFSDKHQVTITGAVPAEATKLVFSTDSGTFKTFFSANGTG